MVRNLVSKWGHSRGAWMTPVSDMWLGGSQYTRQLSPAASSRSKIVSAVLWTGNESAGERLSTNPEEVPAWKNDRLANVCDGTSQNQWSKVAKPRASAEVTGTCAGVYPVMICAYSSYRGSRPISAVNELM